MLRRHMQSNFGGCFLRSASRFCAGAKIIKPPVFFVNTTPSTSSLVRNFSSSTPILLQQQQTKFIKLPSVDDALFTGEFRVIFKLANFLAGREEIPGGNGIPAGFASSELLALTKKLGQIVLTFANISLDDQNNNNNNNNNGGLPKIFRFALALAVFIFERASKVSGGNVHFPGLDAAIYDVMPTNELDATLRLDIYKHMNPILRRSDATLSMELQNQQQQQIQDDEAKKFVEHVLASTRMSVNTAFHKAQVMAAQIAAEKGRASRGARRPWRRSSDYLEDLCGDIHDFDLTTGVTPIPGFRAGLAKALEGVSGNENECQKALLTFFNHTNDNNKIFGVAPNQFIVAMKDFTKDDFHPDATVFLLEHQNPMGRLAILELQVGEISPDSAEYDVSQLVRRLAAGIVENPCRPFVYGISTDGTSVQMIKARDETPGSRRKVFERIVNECDPKKAKANREKLLDCLEFVLTRTPEQLGFVSHPTFNVNSTTGEVKMIDGNSSQLGAYALGALLGRGESCRVYACVPTERLQDDLNVNDKSTYANAFVAKFYRTKEAAQHEKSMFDIVASRNIQNTTSMVGFDEDKHVIFVKPECAHFRLLNRCNGDNRVAPKVISAAQVKSLIETLQALHRAGIVHCDIQAQNLLCVAADPDNRAILNDFGRSYLRANMTFSEFRVLVEHDHRSLAKSVAQLTGGEKAWEEAMSTKPGRMEEISLE